jgi:RND family efflux transporter MFP subunit
MRQYRIILLLGYIYLAASSCRQQVPTANETGEAISVRTQIVTDKVVVLPVRTSGKLSSKTESRLSFKTGGIIEKIYVDDGQAVRKDELLARLNLEEISSQVRQAELALQKAIRDFERIENLYKDSVATLEQYQNTRTALEVARANIRIARFNLEYSEIKAPSDGKILRKLAEVNEITGQGQPVLFFASTEANWVVRVSLTDRDIVRVNLLDSATVVFDAWPGKPFMCQVSETGKAADPYTGTYEVELLLVEKPENLASGFIGKVTIFPSDTVSYPVIPIEALVDGKGSTGTVYVVENDLPARRTVVIHAITDEGIVVRYGLKAGEEIIVDGGAFVREGVGIRRD